MKYHDGACAWVTVPLSGHAAPLVPWFVGDMPPPSTALTVQSVTPAGVRPLVYINCQSACSSTVVPEAGVVPPRETNVAFPAAPAAATSANACAMLCTSAAGTAEAVDGPARTKSFVKMALPYWLLYE